MNSELLQTYRSKKFISGMAWTIAMSFFHFGYSILYITQIPTATIKDIYSIELSQGATDGVINGCIPIGGLIGALGSSFFISKCSRRKSLIVTNILAFIVGSLIFVQNFPMLVICRFIQGFCIGLFSSIAPLIITEISPIQISGALGSYTELNICLGIFFACFAPYLLLKITGDATGRSYWYLVFGIPQIVIILQLFLLQFVFPYETPKYLLSIRDETEARKLIEMIYLPQYVEDILKQKQIELERQNNVLKLSRVESEKTEQQLIDKTKDNEDLKTSVIPFLVTLHLAALQQLSGINVVSVYADTLSKEIATGELALVLPSVINSLELLSTLVSFFLLGRFGRRPILLYGTIFVTIANALIMAGYFFKDGTSYGLPILLTGIFLFTLCFGMSVGPVTWLYIPQVVAPNKVPYSTAVNWICAAFVIILFPILTEDYLGGNPAFLFIFSTFWGFASSFINYFFLLETKDKNEKTIRQEYASIKVCGQ